MSVIEELMGKARNLVREDRAAAADLVRDALVEERLDQLQAEADADADAEERAARARAALEAAEERREEVQDEAAIAAARADAAIDQLAQAWSAMGEKMHLLSVAEAWVDAAGGKARRRGGERIKLALRRAVFRASPQLARDLGCTPPARAKSAPLTDSLFAETD
ncbi:MAG: hypothetical protein AAFV51_11420 [Pseudomonadota bacterium]